MVMESDRSNRSQRPDFLARKAQVIGEEMARMIAANLCTRYALRSHRPDSSARLAGFGCHLGTLSLPPLSAETSLSRLLPGHADLDRLHERACHMIGIAGTLTELG